MERSSRKQGCKHTRRDRGVSSAAYSLFSGGVRGVMAPALFLVSVPGAVVVVGAVRGAVQWAALSGAATIPARLRMRAAPRC